MPKCYIYKNDKISELTAQKEKLKEEAKSKPKICVEKKKYHIESGDLVELQAHVSKTF